jgi:hypothetical protein
MRARTLAVTFVGRLMTGLVLVMFGHAITGRRSIQ